MCSTDNLGFVRAPAFDGTHGPEVSSNSLDLEETAMKRLFRRIKRRLAYLAKDSDERAVLIADIALALAAAAFGAAAMYAALN